MRRVFHRPRYLLLAAGISTVTFLGIAWATAIPLFVRIVTDASLPLSRALFLGKTLLSASLFDFTALGFAYATATALLIGVNTTLLLFYIRMYRAAPSSTATASGILGGLSALLGFGCAACGSIFIISFFGTLGGAGILAFLPYGGEEIGYIGISLLAMSVFFLVRAINKPLVCPI